MPYYIGDQYTKTAIVQPVNANGITYLWSGTNISIIGGNNGQSVTFTPTNNQFSLGVQVDNSCSSPQVVLLSDTACNYLDFDGFTLPSDLCQTTAIINLIDREGNPSFVDTNSTYAPTITWEASTGITITSGETTEQVVFTWTPGFTSATLTVTLVDCNNRTITDTVTVSCSPCVEIESVDIID